MRISEIYESRQGEGLLVGTPSVFLRTSGCNLRCDFCDTPFASWSPEGETFTLTRILERLGEFEANHIVITGGEPMLPREIIPLTHAIKRLGKHITIETAGTVDRSVACDLMSISPKMSNSTPSIERAGGWAARHEAQRLQLPVLNSLIERYPYQLKFVVEHESDLQEIEALLKQLKRVSRDRVLLMPEGTDLEILRSREEWLISLCARHGYQFCPRKHIEWYGNQRGT